MSRRISASAALGRASCAHWRSQREHRGFSAVYLQVQPERTPHVVELYQKLGYQPLQSKPYPDPYHTVDDEGNVREGTEMIVDMRKLLD